MHKPQHPIPTNLNTGQGVGRGLSGFLHMCLVGRIHMPSQTTHDTSTQGS